MSLKEKISKLLRVSVVKTLIFNSYYLGAGRGVFRPYFLVSKNVRIGKLGGKVNFINPSIGCVRLGFNDIGIFDRRTTPLVWRNSGTITFKERAFIGYGARIDISGEMCCGKDFTLNGDTAIVAENKISFGDNCLLSWGSILMDTDFHSVYYSDDKRTNQDKPIIVGDDVWIGCNCIILKGTTLNNGCLVAAGSVVTKDVPARTIVAGNPAEVVKENIHWDRTN